MGQMPKTRIKVYEDAVLLNLPLFCRKCQKETVVNMPYGTVTCESSGVLIQGITGPGQLTIYEMYSALVEGK